MKLDLKYDPALDVWTLTHHDVRLQTLSDIREWEKQVRASMEQMREPAFMLVDLTGLALSPEMGPEFGTLLKNFVLPRTKGVVRFGQIDEMTRRAIQLQATVNRFPANLQPDRASALELIERLRRSSGG